jgi:hypothetical protein
VIPALALARKNAAKENEWSERKDVESDFFLFSAANGEKRQKTNILRRKKSTKTCYTQGFRRVNPKTLRKHKTLHGSLWRI